MLKKIDLPGIGFLIIFIVVFFVGDLNNTPINPGMPSSHPVEEGKEGGPNSRLKFEWLRLKSPITNKIPDGIKLRSLKYAKTLPKANRLPIRMKGAQSNQSNLEWTLRGPYNVGGRTRGVVIDKMDPNTILAGGVSGGIWRSEDGGKSWKKMTKSQQLHSVSSLVQDPRDGKTNIWYATTGELRGNSAGARGAAFRGDGIYKSTDNGYNWELITSTSTNTPESFDNYLNYSWRVKVHPTTGHVFTASFGSIYKSEDEGATWNAILGNGEDRFTDLTMTSNGLLIAILGDEEAEGPIMRSKDGETWTNITPTSFTTSFERLVADISESNDSIAYFIGNTNDGHIFWKYKYLSGDGSGNGGAWEDRSQFLPNDYNSQSGYDIHVRVSLTDTNMVYYGGTNLYYSTDGVATTSRNFKFGGYGADNHHPDQHDVILFKDTPFKVLSASDGGVHVMNDHNAWDKKWESLNNGYVTTQFYTIAIDPSGTYPDLVMGGTQDNGTYETTVKDVENPWEHVNGGDGAYCSVIHSGKAYILSSQNGYTLIKDYANPFEWSFGEGRYNNYSWAYLHPPDFNRDEDALFINPFYSDPLNDHILYYSGGKYVYRNKDVYLNKTNYKQPDGGGSYESVNWEKLSIASIGSVSAFGASINKPAHRLYYGTSSGYIYRLDDAHEKDNVVEIRNNIGAFGYVSSISVDPYDGDNVMVSFSNYETKSIFYSDNGGDSWTDVSGKLEENPGGSGSGPSVRSVNIFPLKVGYLYFAGTSTGLYSTSKLDGVNTQWIQEGSETIGNVVVDMITGRPSDGYLAIATHGNGIYTTHISSDALAVNDLDIPGRFELNQNYPNPFNPATHISYNLNQGGLVSLTVFDLMGKEVATLVKDHQEPGAHQAIWNGKDRNGNAMPSGMYFYQLIANGFAQTKKMQLLK
ncbi:MAG: T9SS type A sorting domain-containing protein [Candidatus Marinimicrobia bacterium]|nr:T9SS type A sorting domain-containing protein [Candidatus Neomarinimicrobiota bacterium]MBL7010125.1 T9SS type A sorting domain-containing protein [Candidatus Neomarinimicrobiota bacterium]MBL7030390.1 T9SS type A sorting domain-containing protein [Candidatus Neomarinimicrobiota bacterium]